MHPKNIKSNQLLSREQFKELVFKRDSYKCLFCNEKAVDAHHILERRLFSNGGYYLNNGASVCENHHLECEKTLITIEQIRIKAKIKNPILPPEFQSNVIYDKWGNKIIDSSTRVYGPLGRDEGMLKILKSLNLVWLCHELQNHQ